MVLWGWDFDFVLRWVVCLMLLKGVSMQACESARRLALAYPSLGVGYISPLSGYLL